ncbi:MAG: ATP-binding cassette domain-containing protein, partial [Calditrichales bacterium]
MLKFIINRRVFITMLFTALTLLGYISYRNLSVEILPTVELPFLFVQVGGFRDMDPQYVEKQAVIPLEGAIGTLEGIEKIESFANRRTGRIIVYYTPNTNLKYAYLKLQEKVDAIRSTLPAEFVVQVVKVDTDMLSNMFMNLQVRGSGGSNRIRHLFEQKIRDPLEALDGIANVEVFGGQEKSVEIILNEEVSQAYQITPAYIRSIINRGQQKKLFVGAAHDFQKKVFVNLMAEYTDINDLENIVIEPTVPILLKDVATINFDVKEESSISRINGKDAVTVQLIHDGRTNLIDLSHKTTEIIATLNQQLASQDIEIVVQQNTAVYLEDNIDLIIDLAITGGIIAIFVLWFFLRNLRLVFVIALSLPISIFTAFNFFYGFGVTLNSLTLVGMALAVGMLLDNSIVVLENIFRLSRTKMDHETAVIQGTTEVWRSIFAATLTTTTVFLPFIFASNFIIRTLGYHISVSIISTLVVSLFVALFLIPMAANYFFQKTATHFPRFQARSSANRSIQIYTLLLKSAMRFPLRTVLSTVIIFFVSIIIAIAVSMSGQEPAETGDFNLYVTMPGGATLETTDLAVRELEERLQNIDEVQDMISQVYEEDAIVTLKLKEDFETIAGRSIAETKTAIGERFSHFHTADVSFEQPQSSARFQGGSRGEMTASFERMLGVGTQNESVIIKGHDFEVMRRVADDIQYQIGELPSVRRVRVNVPSNRPELHLLFDKALMNSYGVTLADVASELSNFQREVSVGATFKQDNQDYEILIRNENLEEQTADDLKMLPVRSQEGQHFTIEEISRLVFTEGGGGINRVNQEKQIVVSYSFLDEVAESATFLEAARGEVEQLISSLQIPSGIAIERQQAEDDLSDFYFLIGVAFLLIYMILAAVFESLITPFVIMFTIPLAAIGSLWAIIFTNNFLLNANTLIGFLILLGIVVNNGIILIDYTRILRERNFRRSRALITAGKARLRPILITAITTIVAMLPLAMGKVEYVTSIAAPFAITVIGGLSLSTVFTLIFIPTVYSGLENALDWFRNLDWRLKIIQGILFLAGSLFIYYEIESIIWRFANLFLLLLVIPGGTYFILSSLRAAREEIVDPKESLIISIRNLYKIYDLPGRFQREWNKGKLVSSEGSEGIQPAIITRLLQQSWHLGVFLFLAYFVYFYLDHDVWLFILSHFVFFYGFAILRFLQKHLAPVIRNRKIYTLVMRTADIFLWFFPLVNLGLFAYRWDDILTVLFIAVTWYFAIIVYTTSNRLARNLVNVNRITGRFSGIKRRYYRLIQNIPVIGKKTTPFRALAGISLDIGSGMFGLLGPNGAGKTTLMRIICGILEQNYGSIHINRIDVREKREELQGLIGYLPQDFGTYENMSAFDFLSYQAILKNILDRGERDERVRYVLGAVHMSEHQDKKIGSFSGGMKQRIGIAQTLLHLPRILVVDEPTAGLDPRERIRFRNLLVELSRERIVIFSTHIIEDIASSCDKVAVLSSGKLKYLGEPVEMVKLARGHVWQCLVSNEQFDIIRQETNIVHHIRVGDQIRIRILA